MTDCSMLVTGHGDKTGLRMLTCHDGVEPLIHTPPWLLALNVDGPAMLPRFGTPSMKTALKDKIAKAEPLLIHDGSRVSCDTRCIPVGGGNNHVEELAWIRAPYRATSHTPEALRGIGTPCLFSHDLAAQRNDAHHCPVTGFGQFFSAQRRHMVACVIPCEPLMERGSSMKDAVTFLCNWP
jgi:hypothetical protein